MRHRNAGTGDKAALLALIGISILFAFVIGRGWKTLFSGYGAVASWSAAIVLVAIALSLCWAIASERVHHPNAVSTVAAYFFFLINISALGTINTLFLQFQGSAVVRAEVDKAIITITKLKTEGLSFIDTKEYDEYDRQLGKLMIDLRQEIESPVNCGQGPKALEIINEIKRLVPGFQPLNLGNNCQNFDNKARVDQVITTYKAKIDEGKKVSPVYVAKKNEILAKTTIEAGAQDMLNKVYSIPREITSDAELFSARNDLETVAQTYLLHRQELAARARGQDKLIPSVIDTSSITALGNIGQVIPFIISRLNEIATYIYVLIALLLDVAMILAFKRVILPAARVSGPRRAPSMM
jgi:hypothetical protein